MKKYVVIYMGLGPSVAEMFDNLDDAAKYAEIMNRTRPNREYTVFTQEGK